MTSKSVVNSNWYYYPSYLSLFLISQTGLSLLINFCVDIYTMYLPGNFLKTCMSTFKRICTIFTKVMMFNWYLPYSPVRLAFGPRNCDLAFLPSCSKLLSLLTLTKMMWISKKEIKISCLILHISKLFSSNWRDMSVKDTSFHYISGKATGRPYQHRTFYPTS